MKKIPMFSSHERRKTNLPAFSLYVLLFVVWSPASGVCERSGKPVKSISPLLNRHLKIENPPTIFGTVTGPEGTCIQ
jgi:hypothetical protein